MKNGTQFLPFATGLLLLALCPILLNLWEDQTEATLEQRQLLTGQEASRLAAALDDWQLQLQNQLTQIGEQQLAMLPLPLSNLTALELRNLPANTANWERGNFKGVVVSLDPAARQFYFESRELQTSFMYLVSQGNIIGPSARTIDDSYELTMAIPLSEPDWVLIAWIAREELTLQVARARPQGQLTLEQTGGAFEAIELAVAGQGAPGQPELLEPLEIPEWRLRFRPSAALLQQIPEPSTWLRTAGWASGGAGLVCFMIGLALLYVRSQSSHQPEDHSPVSAHEYQAEQTFAWLKQSASEGSAGTRVTPKPRFEPLTEIPDHLFRANDIRGLVDQELTPRFARHLGRAFATHCIERKHTRIYVGRDARISSETLASALMMGLRETGAEVVDIGQCPTPLLSFVLASQTPAGSGIMVTGSHNPPQYNGFKLAVAGLPLNADQLGRLRERMLQLGFADETGHFSSEDFSARYLRAIETDNPALPALRVVIDGANGAAGPLAVAAFRALGCETRSLYCEPDGNFPNHGPDPSDPANLKDLCDAVVREDADFGVALDGDGDRLVVVTEGGEPVPPDQLFMLFAREALIESPGGSVVFDVKASRLLPELIQHWGGQPVMERAGRTFIQSRVARDKAVLGGELSSHYFFGDRWAAADDGIYAACRLGAILRLHNRTLSELLEEFPLLPGTAEISLPAGENEKQALLDRFRETVDLSGAEIIDIDGLRVEYPSGWGLIRISNTGPKLTLRFEARDEQSLEQIKEKFRQPLRKLLNQQELTF